MARARLAAASAGNAMSAANTTIPTSNVESESTARPATQQPHAVCLPESENEHGCEPCDNEAHDQRPYAM